MTITSTEFDNIVNFFKEVSPQEADQLLADKSSKIIFIGRPTCTYCRKLLPKLNAVVNDNSLDVYYVNSEHPDYSDELREFRNKYGVATVPGLLFSNTKTTKVRTDSSMSEDEIREFLEISK